MKKRALLSIHPEYAEAILLGHKSYEFRKVKFKENVGEIVIYATAPISRVIGSFRVTEILAASPEDIWLQVKDVSGVTKDRFDEYFSNRGIAYAIKVERPFRFVRPRPLSMYISSNVPPQSFCYL